MVLIVVDMQPDFVASFDVIDQVVESVRTAKILGIPVIILEYDDWEPTHGRITRELRGAKSFFAKKITDDGSNECRKVLHRIKKEVGIRNKILLCGVNGAYCVNKTWRGLSHTVHGGDIGVLRSATACERSEDWHLHYPAGVVYEGSMIDFFQSSPSTWA